MQVDGTLNMEEGKLLIVPQSGLAYQKLIAASGLAYLFYRIFVRCGHGLAFTMHVPDMITY